MRTKVFLCVSLMILTTAMNVVEVQGQELPISDKQNSGCISRARGYEVEEEPIPTIILKKEGTILSVEVQNYISNCATSDFVVKSSMSEGNDGSPFTLSISVSPVTGDEVADCMCPYNVSFTIRDLEPNSFYLDCWWYKGLVELTEGEPLVLEDVYENVTIDGMNFTLRKAFHKAMLSKSEWVGEVRIPSELSYEGQTYFVTGICEDAFTGNTALTKVYIPRTIKYMDFGEEYGFYMNPFSRCSALESIEVEEGNPVLCSVDGVLFNKEKTRLYSYPAADNRTSYIVPEGVTWIDGSAFASNQHLVSVSLPDDVTSLGASAFYDCTNLEEVNLPSGLKTLAGYMFWNCKHLKSITIPEGVTHLGNNLFNGCASLTSVTMPESVTTTDYSIFENCTSLKNVTLSPNLEQINHNMFLNCSSLADIQIPGSVTSVMSNAFKGCKALKTLDLPESITRLGDYVFSGCKLESLYIRGTIDFRWTNHYWLFDGMGTETEVYVQPSQVDMFKAIYKGPVYPLPEIAYRPFVEDGKTWNYMQKTLENGGWHETPYSYVVRGDTVVDGKAYKKLYLQKGGTEQLAFMMRQEGSKVFKLKPGQEEKLFFDFGREDIGVVYQLPYEEDDMETASWMIHAIDTIQVSDRLYRRYCCYQTDELEPGQSTIEEGLYTQKDYWVEGIGSAKMGVESYGTVVMPETPSGVKCTFVSCYEDGECIFTADDFYPQTSTKPDDEKDYRPLIEEGKHWTYDDFMPLRPSEYDHYYYYDLRGDTLIAGQQCLKMYSENLMNNSEIKYQGSLFEENKKVYYFSPGKEKAELLYDFDCFVGDTLHVRAGDLVVKDIQTEDNGGIVIKRYTLCEINDMLDISWIEGVGASTDFFSMMPYPGNYSTLSACELNGEKLYQPIKKEPTEEGYHKMGIEGKRWNYIHYYIDNDGEHFDPYWYVVKGDTIIRRTNYKILYYQDEKTERPVCLLREVGREVFKCDFGDNSYDTPLGTSFFHFGRDDFGRVFSWKAKMEAGNTNWMVYNVDTIKVNNRFFRRYTCLQKYSEEGQALTTIEDGDDVWHDIWIEGIGSASSGIEDQKPNHEPPVRTTSDYTYFVSCYENGECIFTADDFYTQSSTKPDDEIAYRPFVEDGKVWKVGTASGNPVQVVDYYYFDGDTIIDGKTCKQMMFQRVVSPDYANEYWTPTPSVTKLGAWYEEDKRVYFYDETKQSMVLKYDFSLEANDTLQLLNVAGASPFIIGSKQTGGIDGFKGVYRDIMMCGDEGQNIHSTYWLEGVGSIDGPTISPCNPILGDPVPEVLMSCTVGDEVIYLNDEYEDGATPAEARKKRIDFTHTIKVRPKAPSKRETSDKKGETVEESLYGEYNDVQLGINLNPLDDAYLVRITDETGKSVYEKAVNAGSIVGLNIDISAYPKGRYTVTVENGSESFTGEFEAQTTGVVENLRIEKLENESIFDLQGRRLSGKPAKGVYIENGRKVYVK